MGFSCGIVGLPNVGKSTLFNALTPGGAEASNYPFCTIEPNVAIVPVPDPRLDDITGILKPTKVTPTTIRVIDIAGLVKGASQGEGLGNQFLGHVREVDAIFHLVRCFEEDDVVHVDGSVDAKRDIETVQVELCLADLETVTKTFEKARSAAKSGERKLMEKAAALQEVQENLQKGTPVRSLKLSALAEEGLLNVHLLTSKPILYVCNVDEGSVGKRNAHVEAVRALAKAEESDVVEISSKVEAELTELPAEEQREFLQELGLSESGRSRLIRAGYDLLGLITYFTTRSRECQAWTIPKGTKAAQAAGRIHSDFERGFICAETYHYHDLMKLKSEAEIRAKGLAHQQGKDYVVADGDIIHFRFNV